MKIQSVFEQHNWIRRFKRSVSVKLRLFCLPYAGGGSQIYQNWAGLLPEVVEVCAVQLPGRENRSNEVCIDNMEKLTTLVADCIGFYQDVPIALFGHSMGALLAYETAKKLENKLWVDLRHVFFSAKRAPHLAKTNRCLHQANDEDLVKELQKLNGTPSELFSDEEFLSIVLPVIRSDYAIIENYEYRPTSPLNCPISLFSGKHDNSVCPDEVLEWRIHTNHQYDFYSMEGDHFFINSHPDLLLQHVNKSISSHCI